MAPSYVSGGQTATLMIRTQSLHQNGHYYCLADSRIYNFNLFLRNHSNDSPHGVILATPTVSTQDALMWWNVTSLDGSLVERYIVEFRCRVRNITFVEKYMSVSASEGTGQIATSASCFGGLGQLYRVKVWAVSGPNISQALVCLPDGQCREEGKREAMTCSHTDCCCENSQCQQPLQNVLPNYSMMHKCTYKYYV